MSNGLLYFIGSIIGGMIGFLCLEILPDLWRIHKENKRRII